MKKALRAGVAVFSLTLVTEVLDAQTLPSSVPLSEVQIQLRPSPPSVPLSEVQILLVTHGGDGCPIGGCVDYRVSIRGDGLVTLEKTTFSPPRSETLKRDVSREDVVALVNAFLDAGFLDLPNRNNVRPVSTLKGDSLEIATRLTIGEPRVEITLTLGTITTKTVQQFADQTGRLDLTALRRRIWKMGGGPEDFWVAN